MSLAHRKRNSAVKDFSKTFVDPTTLLLEALRSVETNGAQIALVVDENDRLLGTITDADVRSLLLMGKQLNTVTCEQIMRREPITLSSTTSREECLALMKAKHIRQCPLVDSNGRVVGMNLLEELISSERLENAVIIMAGGLGTRLGSLTKNCPKPLLPVGGKPLLESIIERLAAQGFYRFFLSVNYLSEKIVEYFGTGEKWRVEINYIHETKRMGTAGSLSLMQKEETLPVVVTNGDVLTFLDFSSMLSYHNQHGAIATLAVAEHSVTIPYGVVKVKDDNIISHIEEKPNIDFFINAGIYVLSPSALKHLKKNEYCDMPTLLSRLHENTIIAYPLRELWIDIGTPRDFETANAIIVQYEKDNI